MLEVFNLFIYILKVSLIELNKKKSFFPFPHFYLVFLGRMYCKHSPSIRFVFLLLRKFIIWVGPGDYFLLFILLIMKMIKSFSFYQQMRKKRLRENSTFFHNAWISFIFFLLYFIVITKIGMFFIIL